MRKIKKINGYLIVKFNAREIQKMEQLGAYGVIDAEFYTGHIEIDRGAMEYEDAETLEIAIEQARGLTSEFDVDEPSITCTIIKETNNREEIMAVDPESMVNEWEEHLQKMIEDTHCPEINLETAQHEFFGFIVALSNLGMYSLDKCAGDYQPREVLFERLFQTAKLSFAQNHINEHARDNHLYKPKVLRESKYTVEALCSKNVSNDRTSGKEGNGNMKKLKKISKKKLRKVSYLIERLPENVQVFTYVALYHTLEELHFQKKYKVVSNVCDALLKSELIKTAPSTQRPVQGVPWSPPHHSMREYAAANLTGQ